MIKYKVHLISQTRVPLEASLTVRTSVSGTTFCTNTWRKTFYHQCCEQHHYNQPVHHPDHRMVQYHSHGCWSGRASPPPVRQSWSWPVEWSRVGWRSSPWTSSRSMSSHGYTQNTQTPSTSQTELPWLQETWTVIKKNKTRLITMRSKPDYFDFVLL